MLKNKWFLMDEVKADGGDGGAAGSAAGAGSSGAAAGSAGASGTAADGAGATAGKGDGAAAAGAATAGSGAAGAGDGKAAGEAGQKGYWPNDWLTKVSKGDEKAANQLGRYASPEALADAYLHLKRRQDSGELKGALPKNAKPEEITAWRKDNGIPETADGYDLKDLEIPKEDAEIVKGMVAKLHAQHATPEVVKAAVGSYYEEFNRQAQVRAEKDESERMEVIDALGAEWGGKFSSYKGRVENVLSIFPESVRNAVKSARLPDGRALFNHPDVMRGFLAISLRDIPEGINVPSGDGDLGKSMTDRYTEITKMMRENRYEYNRNAAVQKEYTSLITAMEKQGLIDKNGNLVEQRKAA